MITQSNGLECYAERVPNPGGKLGSSARHNIIWDAVDAEEMLHQKMPCLRGQWEFGQPLKINL